MDEVPASQIIRGRRPPSVQWPSARQEIPKRGQSVVSKIWAPGSILQRRPCEFGRCSQKNEDGGFCGVRDTISLPSEASLAEANTKIARLEGSLAVLGPDDIAERRVLEDARAVIAPVWQRLDECRKCCERAAKLLEKAQEVVCEALKVQIQREEELAEGKRRLEALQSEAAAQPVPVPQPTVPGTDELTHLRSHVAQLEGDLRQSHQLATEKISAESSLKHANRSSHARGCSCGVCQHQQVPQRWRWCQSPAQDLRLSRRQTRNAPECTEKVLNEVVHSWCQIRTQGREGGRSHKPRSLRSRNLASASSEDELEVLTTVLASQEQFERAGGKRVTGTQTH